MEKHELGHTLYIVGLYYIRTECFLGNFGANRSFFKNDKLEMNDFDNSKLRVNLN